MAPFGKLYTSGQNPYRSNAILAVAKEDKLELEHVKESYGEDSSPDFLKLNKLGKVPTFLGQDGFVLTECMAIAIYITSQNEKTTLLGKSKQEYAQIVKWMSFANTDTITQVGAWIAPLTGRQPYNKKNVETAQEKTHKVIQVYEDHLMLNTYLVGERITLADIFCASLFAAGFKYIFDKQWRSEFPNITRWFETIANQHMFKAVAGEPELCEEAIKYQPPAKEKKEAPPKQEAPKETPKAKAKAAEDDEEEDEAKPEPKPKHPLEGLGKPTVAIDDWKRQFKNEETRQTALPWFWSNMNFDEYSIWQVDYKYNDELTMIFMTSNLIGGFFARLEGSRKYIMGCCSVFGVANDSAVRGAFLVRGQEALPAFEVAPDYESYEFKKLDPKNDKDKAFFEDMMAWDKPIEIKGKSYAWADGKIFV